MKAIFLGKFQPPHIGHLMTILTLAEEYEELIIGITDSNPKVISQEESLHILKKILKNNDNINLEIVPGDFTKGTAEIKSGFDILCSGNPEVLKKGKEYGYQTRFIPRYNDVVFSGSNERMILEKNLKTPIAPIFLIQEVEVDRLKPIELINKQHFASLESQILKEGIMKEPLIVDSKSMAVLDGSHRYAFCKKYNIDKIDVLLVDYDSDLISVGTRLHHRIEVDSELWLSKEKVRMTAHSGKLFHPRTTRHFFPFRKPRIDFQFNHTLQSTTSIDYLISSNSKADELKLNLDYIDEIEVEIGKIQAYLEEQLKVKEWLKVQNEFIKDDN